MLKQNGKYAQIPGVPYPEPVEEPAYVFREYPKHVIVNGVARTANNPDEEAYLIGLNHHAEPSPQSFPVLPVGFPAGFAQVFPPDIAVRLVPAGPSVVVEPAKEPEEHA